MTQLCNVKQILSFYEGENPGVLTNISRILNAGHLAGTGKVVILPVDQGFEHGPDKSFIKNPMGYDPHYHFKMAIHAGLNAYAAPLGMLEAGCVTFAGKIPTILKMNSSNSLLPKAKSGDQAITASVNDALRLGCSAVGLTIYPGSDASLDMFEEAKEVTKEAKSKGLAVVMWSYPRGPELPKEYETSLDVVSYAAHIACLLGANIIKVKPPKDSFMNKDIKKSYDDAGISYGTLADRISIVKKHSCFNGRRIVIFSGGEAKDDTSIYNEITEIAKGGGNGSIIGRNTFQRPFDEAVKMLDKIIGIYKN